eukprot:6847818-Alexandrium_andersonii.AAC.1
MAGLVHTDQDQAQYIGAKLSDSFNAELSAIVWAMSWVAQWNGQCRSSCRVVIHFDCLSAAMMAQGIWWGKGDNQAVVVARVLVTVLEPWVSMQFEHVRGHSGQPWNELCDGMAAARAGHKQC